MRGFRLWAGSTLVFLAVAFFFTGPASAQLVYGPLTISGQYSYTINSNDGHQNPNNNSVAPGIIPGLVEDTHNPSFSYMGQFLQLRIAARFGEHWSVFLEPQVWHDLTKSVDEHYIQYESQPWNYRGSGYFLGGGGNDLKATLWQGFVDYRNGPLWIRAGRQSVAWGEAIALRILDQVDSLDVADYFFYGRAFEEFDYERIPELGIRADYQLSNEWIPNLAIDTFISPGTFTPNILPAQGAPYNVFPSFLLYKEKVHQGKPIGALQLSGTVKGVDLTLNMITRPNSFPVPIADGLVPDTSTGLPIAAPFCKPFCRILLKGEHPRFWLFGGSANYFWEAVGAMLRLETAVVPDSPGALATSGGVPLKVVKRPVWSSMFSVERPTYLFPGMSALFISFETEFIYNAGSTQHLFSLAPNPGAAVDSNEVIPVVFLQQPILHDTADLEFLSVLDTADGHWLQPGLHYQLRNNLAFDIYYNSFGGAKSSRFPGLHWYADGAWARLTFQF